MAPPHPRRPIAKDRFAALFPTLKIQTYHDPASRGPGSHTIRTIAWNPTGHLIATGSADRTLRIWNPEKPQVKNSTELRGHTGGIERVAWNPTKEAELASVSSDGTCRFWDVRSKTCTATVQLGGEGLTIAWAADGSVVMVGRKDDTLIPITIHPTPTPQPPHPPTLQTNQCTFTHTTPPTHLLLTRGDGSVTITSYPTLHPLHTLHAHTSSCLSLALSPTARYLAIGGSDALISLYDTTDWVCKRTLTHLTGAVKSVGFSFDGSFVVGGSDEGNVLEVAHTESGEYVGKVDIGGSGGCGVLAWHPGRYWIAWAGEGSGLKILGAAGGQL
ncbi:WD40-repeat-containing domain protein [Usnea florida]